MTQTQAVQKQSFVTPHAPSPSTAFSQAVGKGGLVQISGQGPQSPETGEYLHSGDVGAQTTLTLRNVGAVLDAAGLGYEDVISVRVFLTRRDHFEEMNRAYEAFMNSHVPSGVFPARTTVMVELPRQEMLVEIDALAAG